MKKLPELLFGLVAVGLVLAGVLAVLSAAGTATTCRDSRDSRTVTAA
jgi:hypothetical protein